MLYAELRLIESVNVESICNTKPVFENYITPFPESSVNAINLNEIEIGLTGNEFQLIYKPGHRKIVPVIVDPLNGEEISHPIMRLLWEIAHQSPFDFFPYSLRKHKALTHIPQLNWGSIVLQTRRWTIQYSSFSSILDLDTWMKENDLPDPIVMGYLDRELLLHWSGKNDMEILWTELCKWKRLILSDPIWLKQPLYNSQNAMAVYPQYIVQQGTFKKEIPLPAFVNSIEVAANDCLYILIRIQEEECLDFLDGFFDRELLAFLGQEKITWYFIVYPGQMHLQIRLRFLNLKMSQKSRLGVLLTEISEKNRLNHEFRSYYPEQKKYGKNSYTKSEQLFHLESSLLAGAGLAKPEGRILWNKPMKTELMLRLWTGVILDSQAERFYFNFLKSKVKSIPNSEKKDSRIYLKEINNPPALPIEYLDWVRSYHTILFSHSRFLEGKEAGLALVQNHIHMQVNRFFPTERKQMENLVYRLLYKKLGTELYGRPKTAIGG